MHWNGSKHLMDMKWLRKHPSTTSEPFPLDIHSKFLIFIPCVVGYARHLFKIFDWFSTRDNSCTHFVSFGSLSVKISLLCLSAPNSSFNPFPTILPCKNTPPSSYAPLYHHNKINYSLYSWTGCLCSLLFFYYFSNIGQSNRSNCA